MIASAASPYSRARSPMGLPGTYGAMRRTYSGAMVATRAPASFSAFIAKSIEQLGPSGDRDGIRTEELQERCALAQLGERSGDGRVVAVTVEIDEKQILPQ